MANSFSPNTQLVIKPNRFFRARFRNIRWNRDTIYNSVDSASVNGDNLPETITEPETINQTLSNARITRIKDRYNE